MTNTGSTEVPITVTVTITLNIADIANAATLMGDTTTPEEMVQNAAEMIVSAGTDAVRTRMIKMATENGAHANTNIWTRMIKWTEALRTMVTAHAA